MIKAGEIVQCPKCDTEIAQVATPLVIGMKLDSLPLNWIKWEYRNGDPMRCKGCGSGWFVHGQLHIKGKGWTP